MSQKRIARLARARQDFDEAVDYYLTEASVDVALRWISELEGVFDHIAEYPGSGSPRYGHELRIAGLRSWPLTDFPYLVFYVEGDQVIEVWRILHGSRNIPATFRLEE